MLVRVEDLLFGLGSKIDENLAQLAQLFVLPRIVSGDVVGDDGGNKGGIKRWREFRLEVEAAEIFSDVGGRCTLSAPGGCLE